MSGLSRRAWLAAAAALPLAEIGAEAQTPATLPEVPAGVIAPSAVAGGQFAGKSWRIQQMLDEDETAALMNDIQFASAERGIVVLSLNRKGKEENQALLTRNGGAKWTPVKLRDFPLSVNMLDESRIFIVGRDALWYSNEGGLTWEKRKLPKLDKAARDAGMFVNRVSFADEKLGWAFGGGKVFHVTKDGGLTWAPVAESEALGLKSENAIWTWMTWVTPKTAMLVGYSASAAKDGARYPDWMVPERAVRRRLTPATTMVAETYDRGGKWKMSIASTFGQVTRMRSLGSRALTVFHYGDGLAYPSEVSALDMATGRNKAFFRRKQIFVQDAVPLNEGGAMVVAVEPPGRLSNSPIPGKIRVFVTSDGASWSEMKVDYRAVGRKATLARFDDQNIWLCTDEGIILRMM
jgi:Photosynthesis system II assembly factor YCF48